MVVDGGLYEVMDDSGHATGELVHPREVFARKLKVKYAQVYLLNSKGELLVQQRSPKANSRPNLLDPSAAGHVEPGQSYEDCAHMEMDEEIGVKTELKKAFAYTGYWGFAEVFTGTWDGDIKLRPEEVANAAWVPLDVMDAIVRYTPWLVSDGFVSSYEIFRGWKKQD